MRRVFVIALSVVTLAFATFLIVQASADNSPTVHSPKGPAGYGLTHPTAPPQLKPPTSVGTPGYTGVPQTAGPLGLGSPPKK